jgi:serine/threonine protein kinase
MTSDVSTCAQCRAPVRPETRNCSSCGAAVGVRLSPRATIDPPEGRTVDQWSIGEKKGEDRFGAIYGAEQTAIGRKAVIKILHPWLSRDPTVVQRFEREARAAARLQNPHIASVHDYGRLPDGSLYLAMEHVPGVSLEERLRTEGRIEPARAVAIATQCLEGLAEAHRRGVLHGGLEPAKIFLIPRGGPDFVKIVDVGISLLAPTHEDARGRHRPGKPRYMAPEQFTGDADHRADLYALGLVVYEMLAGHPPFSEESPQAYERRHQEDPPPALMQSAPDLVVSPSIDACVMRALAKSPHHRPQSADAFADELWAALMATVERSDLPIPVRQRARRRRRSRLGLIAGFGALGGAVAGMGIGAYLFMRPTRQVEPTNEGKPTLPQATIRSEPEAPAVTTLSTRSVAELEAELRNAVTAKQSPSHAELTLQAYRQAVSQIDGRPRKELLIRLVVAWRASDEDPGLEPSLDELEASFLTMPSPLDVQTRRSMLNGLKQAARQDSDPRQTIRVQLGPWIAAYGENASSGEEQPPIEILEADSDS